MKRLLLCCVYLLTSIVLIPCAGEARDELPVIIVTIKPLHAIVQQIVRDDATIIRLVPDGQLPSEIELSPQQVMQLEQADAVVMMDRALEPAIMPFASDDEHRHKVAVMSMIRTLKILPARDPWMRIDDPSHGFFKTKQNPFSHDPYLWLDVRNQHLMMGYIAEFLGMKLPKYRAIFLKRARKAQKRLERLDKEIETKIEPLKNYPFMMVHDVLHYFENRYGVKSMGAIDLVSLSVTPIQRNRVHMVLAKHKVQCVVYQQGAYEDTIKQMIGAYPKRTFAVIDIFGDDVPLNDAFLSQLMHKLVDVITPCLRANPKPFRSPK
ncbi:MAG: zinc ABC transporter substrate-binding protein [Alphaproteobacteria bacterium]|nr:MAG: zinc ABC transporter substrate-binding protein [Alphaproteobacteria bacterium]TAF14534.1 MAG: zinc ABC transporter substrate-binding protein [Alphaproteobacteria bacterium]TAF38514.1 MAG: zinc ABC transporter substrate-binding protein [Alphaproteobacteria bacterium]TAF74913.1 MAG: zinc ABC transporter substrate-binding protein [Alphaproteobacteria bacterium]